MEIKTYPMKVAEGKVCAEITLRDVVERTKDLSDTPILAEIKRLYDENDKLRKLVLHMYTCMGNVDADGNHECFSCEYEGAECDFVDRMRGFGVVE